MGLDYEFCIHGLHSCCSQRYTQSSVIFINKIYTKKNKFFSCELCRKGFLHQNQLYAHHKQRHPNENPEFSIFNQTEQKQEFYDNQTDLFLELQ
jgi:hypothetical protein